MYKFADICGGRFFLIPDNQRGFSWGARQVDDVIADLKLADTQSHYMGPLIVNRTKSPDFQDDELNTTAEFILEDGQQRLTTLFIFANGRLEKPPPRPPLLKSRRPESRNLHR